jgi:hypothetical protein
MESYTSRINLDMRDHAASIIPEDLVGHSPSRHLFSLITYTNISVSFTPPEPELSLGRSRDDYPHCTTTPDGNRIAF